MRHLLSRREEQILRLLSSGVTSASIAADLGISPNTVRTQRQNILRKLGVSTTAHAVGLAFREGLIS